MDSKARNSYSAATGLRRTAAVLIVSLQVRLVNVDDG